MESLSASSGGGGPQISYDQSAALTFHHTDYLLHAYVRYTQPQQANAQAAAAGAPGAAAAAAAAAASPYAHSPPMPILIIEAEQRSNGHRWTGEFSAKYIEEMSLKTGNFKKFSLFIRMLSSALGKTSETVFIDLLTFQDLEALKARKQGAQAQQAGGPQAQQRAQTAAVAQAQNKRYIILTYVAEFDKVHYPLPLKFETDPDPVMLKQTIARLRSEIDLLRANASSAAAAAAGASMGASGPGSAVIEKYKSEIYRLAEENHRLKSLLAARGGAQSGSAASSSASGGGGDDDRGATATLSPLEVEQLQIDHRAVIARADRLAASNAELSRQISGLMAGLPAESLGLQLSLDNLSKQVWNLQSELAAEQSAHARARAKANQEADVMIAELEKRLEAERMLRGKCRALAARIEEMEMAAQAQVRGAGARSATGSARGSAAVLRGSGSAGSVRSGAVRRPVSASSPGRSSAAGAGLPPARGTSAGRPLSRPSSRPGSRPNSRPASAASSRSSSPAPVASSSARGTPTGGRAGGGGGGGGARSRSPSPGGAFGGSAGRFDPSAYVKHRQAQLAQQAARTSAHAREMRSSAGRAASPSPSAPTTGARGRSRSPVMRNGATSPRTSVELSPRTSRSSSNANLSATSPSASLRHSQSQSSRRSPASSSSVTAGQQSFSRTRSLASTSAPAGDTMPPRAPRAGARPASASLMRASRSNGHDHANDDADADDHSAHSPLPPRERERDRVLERERRLDSDLDDTGGSDRDRDHGHDHDEEEEEERPRDRYRRAAAAGSHRRGAAVEDATSDDEQQSESHIKLTNKHRGDNIEERFSALQNFLKQQKVDPLDS